jgi:hypothetical protein
VAPLHKKQKSATNWVGGENKTFEKSDESGRQTEIDVEVAEKIMGHEVGKEETQDFQVYLFLKKGQVQWPLLYHFLGA